jgi:lipopolysaccharide/colanic/teichoic acid biosynthesis glycosyltransferase
MRFLMEGTMHSADEAGTSALSAGLPGRANAERQDREAGNRVAYFGKRVIEVCIGLSVLLLSAPLLLVMAVLIRLDSPGPAIFWQQRLGRHAKPFWFVKFRTMHSDARQRFPDLYRYQYTPEELAALKFKVTDDPRVTRAGRWLRKTSLDELPNFWNLVTGDVALVGPRPEIPEMLAHYHGEELRKFDVRPGITGYAQVYGRGNLKFSETLAYDLAYVRERSWRVDLKVTLRTIKISLLGNGAF